MKGFLFFCIAMLTISSATALESKLVGTEVDRFLRDPYDVINKKWKDSLIDIGAHWGTTNQAFLKDCLLARGHQAEIAAGSTIKEILVSDANLNTINTLVVHIRYTSGRLNICDVITR